VCELWRFYLSLNAQVDGTVKTGDPIKARILDVNKKDGVVDLSLRPLHTAAGSKKAAKALSLMEVQKVTIASALPHSQ
jgi:predicted RNA-binding protein with RPS1 domain